MSVASSSALAAACGLAALLGGGSAARAEECAGDNRAELFAPVPSRVDLPLDAHLWMLFSRVSRVWLSTSPFAQTFAIEAQLVTSEHGGELFTEAVPARPLAPSTKYYVHVERPSSETILYDFTTGERPTDAAPPPPSEPLYLFTWRYDRQPPRCLPGKYLFRVLMPGGRAPGSLYALEKKTSRGFERVAFSDVPDFVTFGDELPSPFYRIRPLSVSGTGASAAALAAVRAERVDKVVGEVSPVELDEAPLPDDGAWDDDENWAGCAAPRHAGRGGGALLALLAAAALRKPSRRT